MGSRRPISTGRRGTHTRGPNNYLAPGSSSFGARGAKRRLLVSLGALGGSTTSLGATRVAFCEKESPFLRFVLV